jgi:hypothetical protein
MEYGVTGSRQGLVSSALLISGSGEDNCVTILVLCDKAWRKLSLYCTLYHLANMLTYLSTSSLELATPNEFCTKSTFQTTSLLTYGLLLGKKFKVLFRINSSSPSLKALSIPQPKHVSSQPSATTPPLPKHLTRAPQPFPAPP